MKKFTFFFCALMLCLSAGAVSDLKVPHPIDMQTYEKAPVTIQQQTFNRPSSMHRLQADARIIFQDNYLIYTITGYNPNTVEVTGHVFSTSTTLDLIIPDSVTSYGLNYEVKSIGSQVFNNCSGITSVTIPTSIDSIGLNAFKNCSNLQSVTWNAKNCKIYSRDNNGSVYFSDTPFANSSSISSFTFGNAVEIIPVGICYGLTSLSTVSISENVNAIASGAFMGCNSLASISIPDGVIEISNSAFSNCTGLTSIVIPDGVKSIGYEAFWNCSSLTSISIPESVQSIDNLAFYNCSNLTTILVPQNITALGGAVFYGCVGLTSVNWNAKSCVITTGYSRDYDYNFTSPFDNCSNITSIAFGDSVYIIPDYLCANQNQITSLTLPNSVTTIGASAFRECSALTTMNIPNSVTTIGGSAFYSCNNLNSLAISENLTIIDNYTFYGCSSLTSLIIPESVQEIGYEAFGNCSNLSSVQIPQSVTILMSDAFSGCDNITSVTWNAQNCAVGYYESNNYDEDGNEYYTYDWRDATSSPFPSSVQTITFGNQVQTIPAYLCYNLSDVTSITIPNSVTRINNSAFQNCTSLASINLSSNLDYIGSKAFVNSGLMSVMIPESLDTIVSDAFYYYDYDNNDNNSNLSLVIWNARNCANVSTSQNWNSQLQEYEYSYYESTSSPFPSSVETFIFGDNVQKVPSGLCSGLNQLTSIALSNTVRTIGNSAFYRCSGLISFTMENGVQTIGNDAFYGCSNLPQIVMPNTVTKIGNYAFSNCSNLTTAIVGNSVDTIGGSAFSYCKRLISIELPTTVNYIGGSAFYNCTSMNKAIIRSTAELDPYCMLLLNPQIDTIIAPASIFDIDEQHRLNYVCTKRMKYVKANSGELTEDAFVVIRRSASTLETLDVSATTNTTIADEAFSNMYRLTTLGLPQGLDRISYKAVAECVRLQSIDIPAGITEIGDRAFEDCRSLTTVTFGGQSGATADVALQTIGNWAFYNNHALQHLAIPSGVTTIGAGAFYGCTYLEDLAMPASLRNVGDNAFALCNHLTKMQVEADLPPMVAARTFFDVSRNIPVFVPDASVNDYRTTAVWQEFNIRPISQAATGIETVRESDNEDELLPDGKFFQDGKLLIRRNGKTYDAQGRLIQ